MIEPVLGITRVKSVTSYNPDERRPRDSFKKKPASGLSFQEILNSKSKSEQAPQPYQVSLRNKI